MPVTQFIWISIKNMFQYDSTCMCMYRLFDFITMSFILYPMRFVNFLQYVCYYIWLKHEMDQECGTCLWVWNFRIDCFLIYVNVHHDFIYMWHCLLSGDHQIWFYLAIYEWLIHLQWLIFAINFFFIINVKQRAKNIKDLVCNEKYSE